MRIIYNKLSEKERKIVEKTKSLDRIGNNCAKGDCWNVFFGVEEQWQKKAGNIIELFFTSWLARVVSAEAWS